MKPNNKLKELKSVRRCFFYVNFNLTSSDVFTGLGMI